MRKLYITIFFTAIYAITCTAQKSFTRDELFQIIKHKSFVDIFKDEISVSTQIIEPNTKLRFMYTELASPSFASWFFLIDHHPQSDWTHPCKYVFISPNDTSITVIEGIEGPSFDTQTILFQQQFIQIPNPPR